MIIHFSVELKGYLFSIGLNITTGVAIHTENLFRSIFSNCKIAAKLCKNNVFKKCELDYSFELIVDLSEIIYFLNI